MALDLQKMSATAQLVLFLFLGALLYGAFHYFVHADMKQQILTKTAQRKALEDEVEKGKGVAARLQEFKRAYEVGEAQLATLSRILPNKKEVDDLVRKVQALAAQSSLTVLRFTPGATRPVDFYAEWPINLEFDGTYHNLAYFFDRLSKLSRIVNVSNVKITANQKPSISSTIKASCTATTFVFQDEQEPAAGGPAGATPGRPGAAAARPPTPPAR
jgi:type IV pilus assembly protein PilO